MELLNQENDKTNIIEPIETNDTNVIVNVIDTNVI